jgi:peptidyl-prolyl cis-trans isomerase C
MSDNKSNTPIIIGVVALLAVLGGAAFYFSKNMTKDAPAVAEATMEAPAPAAGDAAGASSAAEAPQTAATSAKSSSPEASNEEVAEAESMNGGEFNGVKLKKGNPVVAKVDGEEITRVDVVRFIKMMPEQIKQLPPTAVYPLALEQVINTRVVQNKAEDAGLENDPEVLRELAMAKQQIIRAKYVEQVLDKEIKDSDLKKIYDQEVGKLPDVEEIKAAHILVDSEDKAKELITKLKDGADFAKLASENSADPGNKDQGGDLGWFSKDQMVPEFADAAFKLGKGKVSETPTKTQFGWHVIKVEDTRKRPKPTFEEVKPQLMVEARRSKLEAMLEDCKKTAAIEKFDINGDPIKEQPEVAPAAGEQSVPAPAAAE